MRWNDALARHFFSPEAAGRPVYLFVTKDLLDELGTPFGGRFNDFLAAVRAGPPGVTRPGHCQRALQIADRWRDHGYEYPPYLAYLCLFVLAGGHEGEEFDPRDYYPRLWDLLGESDAGTPPSFERMLELWDDLERWSVQDRAGALGLFEARIAGGKIHIGLPLAQTFLTEEERDDLPRIFVDAGLEPGVLPSDTELRRALVLHGRTVLRRRTIAVLGQDSSTRDALLDVVSDDFHEWDGTLPTGTDQLASSVAAGMRLCLHVDRVSASARSTLRCHSQRELPELGLTLTSNGINSTLSCTAFLPNWSTELKAAESADTFEPPSHVWSEGLSLSDDGAGWKLTLPSASVRAFVTGEAHQLPGLIEVTELPRRQPFYVATEPSAWTRIEPWLTKDCVGWRPIVIASGLPPAWIFGSVDEALTDDGPRAVGERLGFRDRRNIRLVGGIRAGTGNTFFDFAAPLVILDGGVPGDIVTCNGVELLERELQPGSFDLPVLPSDARVNIEVRAGDSVLKRRSIFLASGFSWRLDEPLATVDGFGSLTGIGEGIYGAHAANAGEAFQADLLRTPGLEGTEGRTFFIGRRKGQIVSWPSEPMPAWEVVWAVPLSRRGRALFCANSVEDVDPLDETADSARVDLWREVLWRRRDRIAPPTERTLAALWRRYRETARRG